MLVEQIAANQKSVGVVTFPDAKTGQLVAGGTAFHVGDGIFVTASNLLPDALKVGAKLVVWLNWTQPNTHAAVIEHRSAKDDVAILRVEANLDEVIPALDIEAADEPVGLQLFAYGFVEPQCRLEKGGWITTAIPRASVGILGSRYVKDGALVYEADFATYPGESGAPVFRVKDNVVIGVVRGARTIKTKEGLVRGPTLIAPIKAALEA
jgi:hypothetical protein